MITTTPLRRFTAEELRARDTELGVADEHWYNDDELDALEQQNPLLSARIAQRQTRLARLQGHIAPGDAPPLTTEGLTIVLEEARSVLLRDGGDLELVDFSGTVVRVRLKGACTGCPNSVLDLKNVVETIVRRTYPQVTDVRNTY
ncbi:MAG: NifU family protein [Betaproteobacteria bacterium]|nr:NifU family protein [Betaproteobacteria bacterium]